ncbi:uncharacterized protein LOC105632249 [Jatropha curcas]|uniref:uncharacterized protein LOC105632249 n=1 Tax=Jatropha curcas TaxID=180498 RepID=UPI0009D6DC25|nr:uncharacterized protein LOC105632249 [Jatropha curcas]
MSPFLVFLLISFSLHACNARFLGFNDKDLHKVHLHQISIPSEMISPAPEEVGEIDRRRIHENSLNIGATTMKQNKELTSFKEEESTKTGNELIVFSQDGLQDKDKIEGWKRPRRSMLGSVPSDTEEAVESNENDIAEGVVVTDYAQPHRKPPIHNEKL